MIGSKIQMLSSALIFSCICATALGSEPNKPEEELGLKFELSDQPADYSSRRRPDPTTIWPTYMAQLFMNHRPDALSRRLDPGHLFQTSAGQTLSEKQRAFMLSDSFCVHAWTGSDEQLVGQRLYRCSLYAISQDDAKKMAESLIEYVNGFSNDRRHRSEELRKRTEAGVNETKKLILEKQKLSEAAALNFQTLKNTPRYSFLKDVEAWQNAKETIVETNRILDVLDIELAGIQEKLKVLESYRRTKRLPRKALSNETIDKLDQMFVEQMVDLASAEARKRKALEIREQDGKFVSLFDEWDHLQFELNDLERKLKNLELDLVKIERELEDQQMFPPEVYQNMVTIHPVRAK